MSLRERVWQESREAGRWFNSAGPWQVARRRWGRLVMLIYYGELAPAPVLIYPNGRRSCL